MACAPLPEGPCAGTVRLLDFLGFSKEKTSLWCCADKKKKGGDRIWTLDFMKIHTVTDFLPANAYTVQMHNLQHTGDE